jgi:hypothetical protein
VYIDVSSAECRSKAGHKSSKQIVRKCSRVQIFGKVANRLLGNVAQFKYLEK